MSGSNHSEELENIVNLMLSKSPNEQFRKYWELYKETAYISEPKAFYFRTSQDATYRNVVIAGDSVIVDIEADENVAEGRGVYARPYKSLSAVILHLGPIQTLDRSQNARLTVACLTESSSLGPYWSAHSEGEVQSLQKFAEILIEKVSR